MSSDGLGMKLQEVWRDLMEAERARGSAHDPVAQAAAQAAYEQALTRFRHLQLEAFTVSLGGVALLREQLEELTGRVTELERAVGEGHRTDDDPLSPY